MAWYNANWSYRVPVESQNAKVAEAVTSGYIDLSELPSGFWDHVQNGGGDIRITKADGTTEVAREIVSCDTGTDTGEVHFDCTGIQTGSDVVWYIYYGNAGASDHAIDDPYGAENVWDSDFEVVYHLQNSFLDSTDHSKDGTDSGTSDAEGKVGRARSFITNDYIKQTSLLDVVPAAIAIDFWFSPRVTFDSGAGANFELVDKDNINIEDRARIYLNSGDGKINWLTEENNNGLKSLLTTNASWTGGTWYHIIFTWDTTNGKQIFVDGAFDVADGAETTLMRNGTYKDFYWGCYQATSAFFDGKLDEIRVLSVIMSANRISTEHNNTSDPATFWSVGAQEANIVIGPIQPQNSSRRIGGAD